MENDVSVSATIDAVALNPLATIMATNPETQLIPEPVLDLDTILSKHTELTPEQASKQIDNCMDRILDMETFFHIPSTLHSTKSLENNSLVAARYGWMLILVRILTRSGSHTTPLKNKFLSYCLLDFKSRMDMCLLWLHEEFYRDECNQSEGYKLCITHVLNAMRDGLDSIPGLDPKDRTFTRFLVEIPELDSMVLDRIRDYCTNPEHRMLGVATLRDLMIFRPAVRSQCGDILLSMCRDSGDLRSVAVNAASVFVGHGSLGALVENFAIETLKTLETEANILEKVELQDIYVEVNVKSEENGMIEESIVEQAELGEVSEEINSDEFIHSRLDLFLSCCSKKQSLLQEYLKLISGSLLYFLPFQIKLKEGSVLTLRAGFPQSALRPNPFSNIFNHSLRDRKT